MKSRKNLYVIISMIILAACLYNVKSYIFMEEVVEGSTETVHAPELNKLIARSVNDMGITLVVDGREINTGKKNLYMDENLNVMIPASIMTEAFTCASGIYDGKTAVLQKGNVKVKADIGDNVIHVNDNKVTVQAAVTKRTDGVYIPAEIVEQGLNYSYTWDINENKAYMVNQKPEESILPYAYDYRENGRDTKIENQGKYGTCWAFAALTALETALLPEEDYDFSEDNMSLNNGYLISLEDGGEYTLAMAYLTSWTGPVLEKDDPYGDYITEVDLDPIKHVQEIQIIEGKNFESIKKAVFLYGGVQSSLYTSLTDSSSNSYYYNKENYSYCYVGTNKPNHDVVIIGWDDNYPKENFNAKIEGDGAFICQNSWGESFGDNGVFYVSYYDSNIGMHNVVYTGVEEIDNYDNIYQSDICGWVGQMGYNDPTAYFANAYTPKEDETLEAVGFYATGKGTEYEIYIVEDFKDTDSFDEKKLIQTGSFNNAGYYTVKLNETIELNEGQKYAVVIKITTPNSVYPIAVEYNAGYSTSLVDLSDGEGYISLRGRSWEHVEETKECNICLKVFTNRR